MNTVDRLIEKARKIKLTYGNNVFVISNETGKWMAEGQEFPSFEAAQAYVDGMIPDNEPDSIVIINHLGNPPAEPEEERKKKYEEWAAAVKAEQVLKENGGREPFQPKDRRLI